MDDDDENGAFLNDNSKLKLGWRKMRVMSPIDSCLDLWMCTPGVAPCMECCGDNLDIYDGKLIPYPAWENTKHIS